jgi:hypothetical protein
MKKLFVSTGMATALAAAAILVPLAAPAGAANPGNVADGCAAGNGPMETTSCTWLADVQGGYVGATDTSWSVTEAATGTQTVNGVTSPVSCTISVAGGGSGPFGSGAPGALQPNKGAPATCGDPGTGTYTGSYTLTVDGNGSGAIGSVTGQPGAV